MLPPLIADRRGHDCARGGDIDPHRAARSLAGVFSKKRRDGEMHTTTVNGELGVVFTSG